MEEIARRVVDIEKDAVEAAGRGGWIKSSGRGGKSEKVAMDHAAPRIIIKRRAKWNEAALVPFDYRIEGIHNDEFAHGRMFERGDRGVAKSKATHDDIVRTGAERFQAEIGERDFDLVKEARHEKGLAELHLEDFKIIKRPHTAAPKGEIAERGFPEVEFGEVSAHRARVGRSVRCGYAHLQAMRPGPGGG